MRWLAVRSRSDLTCPHASLDIVCSRGVCRRVHRPGRVNVISTIPATTRTTLDRVTCARRNVLLLWHWPVLEAWDQAAQLPSICIASSPLSYWIARHRLPTKLYNNPSIRWSAILCRPQSNAQDLCRLTKFRHPVGSYRATRCAVLQDTPSGKGLSRRQGHSTFWFHKELRVILLSILVYVMVERL
jgi:hypothetical protein